MEFMGLGATHADPLQNEKAGGNTPHGAGLSIAFGCQAIQLKVILQLPKVVCLTDAVSLSSRKRTAMCRSLSTSSGLCEALRPNRSSWSCMKLATSARETPRDRRSEACRLDEH